MGFLRFKSEAVKAKVNLHVPLIGSVAAVEQTFRVERGDRSEESRRPRRPFLTLTVKFERQSSDCSPRCGSGQSQHRRLRNKDDRSNPAGFSVDSRV